MYHYIQDKRFQSQMKRVCSDIVNQLVQSINNDSFMTVKADLIGSGAKNLITQNGNKPIDLDYNLYILNIESSNNINSNNIYNCRKIKEYIREQFNIILSKNGWGDCKDSKSVLTTKRRYFEKGPHTQFSIDLAIVFKDNRGSYCKLVHEKTGDISSDRYYWNIMLEDPNIDDKTAKLKKSSYWNEVRDAYLEKKNMYLSRQDNNHKSFNVYIEAVNEIYYQHFS